ncbi:hypothetical protein CBM2633_A70471 [Cupriavidus taiwanensis]|nr:hypothetical protein CBM2604_A100025 [Cupriavidus taiwanensis]SOZ23647.1 hypothetical protein CBM2609_A120025 [Cupriavidus taiwanensis]SPA16564.1 hypothetical protein CBM2633_A70471 [Cupriavidus taiwanensis]
MAVSHTAHRITALPLVVMQSNI